MKLLVSKQGSEQRVPIIIPFSLRVSFFSYSPYHLLLPSIVTVALILMCIILVLLCMYVLIDINGNSEDENGAL